MVIWEAASALAPAAGWRPLRIRLAEDNLINQGLSTGLPGKHRHAVKRKRCLEAGMEEELNRADLLDRVEGDFGLLKEVVDVFRDTYPGMLVELKQAVDRRDAAALTRTAHTLKGMVANFGARAAFAAALRLETLGRAQDLTQVDEAYATLVAAVDRLDLALTRLLVEGGGP
jgi:HPt (histidine-containing phosphotransfer) domain-containing protein